MDIMEKQENDIKRKIERRFAQNVNANVNIENEVRFECCGISLKNQRHDGVELARTLKFNTFLFHLFVDSWVNVSELIVLRFMVVYLHQANSGSGGYMRVLLPHIRFRFDMRTR